MPEAHGGMTSDFLDSLSIRETTTHFPDEILGSPAPVEDVGAWLTRKNGDNTLA